MTKAMYECLNCGKLFHTLHGALRASVSGCPSCGEFDVEPYAIYSRRNLSKNETMPVDQFMNLPVGEVITGWKRG
jgi:predicted  nucleic acid-binding Zn-ribbon protein